MCPPTVSLLLPGPLPGANPPPDTGALATVPSGFIVCDSTGKVGDIGSRGPKDDEEDDDEDAGADECVLSNVNTRKININSDFSSRRSFIFFVGLYEPPPPDAVDLVTLMYKGYDTEIN